MVDYSPYANYVEEICRNNDLSTFKTNPKYVYMLEHVSPEYGQQYLDYIQNNTKLSFEDVQAFCSSNDSVGSPHKIKYGFLTVSPTSLRYVCHAHIILTHLQSLNLSFADIVEVGGGYGGLCLAIYSLSSKYNITIQSYTIVDLPSVLKLQQKYIPLVSSSIHPEFVDATTFGSTITKSNLFLVSNYCFSEISSQFQNEYRKHLFPKVSHGFMTWNHIPVYDFGFPCKVEDERPTTGPQNKYVYF